MLAVSNTSPLRYLVAASHADLLFAFFGEILIPPGVADELLDRGTPGRCARLDRAASGLAAYSSPRLTARRGADFRSR